MNQASESRAMSAREYRAGMKETHACAREICRKRNAWECLACCTFSKSETQVDKFADSQSTRCKKFQLFSRVASKMSLTVI